MKKIFFILLGTIIIGSTAFAVIKSQSANKDAMIHKDMVNDQMMMQKEVSNEAMMMEKDVMMQKEVADKSMMMEKESMLKTDKVMTKEVAMQKGGYTTYDSGKLSFAKNGKVVLFFHAPWCPSCVAYDKKITQNTIMVPENVLLMKTDYDTNMELRKKYGVTSQHTFVQVDENGNLIKKWLGDKDLATL